MQALELQQAVQGEQVLPQHPSWQHADHRLVRLCKHHLQLSLQLTAPPGTLALCMHSWHMLID